MDLVKNDTRFSCSFVWGGNGLLFSSRYNSRVCFTETDDAPSGWEKPPTCHFAFVPGVTEGVGANLSPPFAPLRRILPPPPLPNLGHPVFIESHFGAETVCCAHCPLKALVCEIEQHLIVKKGSYKQNVNVVVTSNKPPSRSKLTSVSQ